MTRQETISAAQAFTEKHKESHKIHLENGYIEASIISINGNVPFQMPERRKASANYFFKKPRIWAIDQNGVFTTEF